MTMSIAKVSPGSRYYLKSVAVGDGVRERGTPLPVGQELAGVPAGEWIGRGAPLLGLSGEVTEAEMELLFGQGLHPHPEILAPDAPEDGVPAVRLGRAFIRPTYEDDQEPGSRRPSTRTTTKRRRRGGGD